MLFYGGNCRKQRSHLVVILDAGFIFHAAGNVDEFGVELFAEGGDVFGIDAACKPQRQIACFFAEERFGDGLAGAAGDAFDFCIEENAGFAIFAEGGHLFEVGIFAYADRAVVSVVVVMICGDAVELYCVEDAFAGELDGGLAFEGIRVGNHADEKWFDRLTNLI